MGISRKEKRIHAVGMSWKEENTCFGYKWEEDNTCCWYK